MYLLVIRVGFGFGVLRAPARLVCVTPLHVLCLHCVWSTMYVYIDRFTFFHSTRISLGLQLGSSQVVNVLVVGPVQLFPFLWFSGGCVFSSSCLRFVVALCFRGLSPCLLICNLWTYVSLTVPTVVALICVYMLLKSVVYITYRFFPRQRVAGFVVPVG